MATTTKMNGFYGTRDEVFFLIDGRLFITASPDFEGVREIPAADLPESATPCNSLMTPDEAAAHLRAIEAETGLSLVETA